MITEHYIKITQEKDSYRFVVKFWIGEECYRTEGTGETEGVCFDKAQEFKESIVRDVIK